jgi:hypothetical protein
VQQPSLSLPMVQFARYRVKAAYGVATVIGSAEP